MKPGILRQLISGLTVPALIGVVVYPAPTNGQSLMQYRQQMAESEKRLQMIRTSHDEKAEAIELIRLGELQAHADQAPKALVTENTALEICIRLNLGMHAGIAVQDIGWIYILLENKKKAEIWLKKGLEMEGEIHNTSAQANTLNNLGDLSMRAGLPTDAFSYYAQALKVSRDSLNRFLEARTLSNIANAQALTGQMKESLKTYQKALDIYRDLKIPSSQATTWRWMALVHFRMSELDKAISNGKIALDTWHSANDRSGEAVGERTLGVFYLHQGDETAARAHFDHAINIHRELGDREGETQDLLTMADRFAQRGQFQKSLEYENRALDMSRQDGNRMAEASTLVKIGYVYTLLGQESKSLDFWSQALKIQVELGKNSRIAQITSNMSTAYANTGHFDKAVEFGNHALSIWREIGNPYGEALTLHTLGWIFEDDRQHRKALDYFEQALTNHHMTRDLQGLYFTLRGMGEAEEALGDHRKALVDELAALSAAEEFRSPPYSAQVEATLMRYWRNQKEPELAVFFGVKAVNTWQTIRQNIRGLDEQDQVEFVRSKSEVYRELAELLMQLDRLGEAEQVLDLLKREELQEVVRGDSPSDRKLNPLGLSPGQRNAENDLPLTVEKALALVDVSVELTALRAKNNRTPDEEQRFKILEAKMEAETSSVSKFFKDTLYPELTRHADSEGANTLLAGEKSGISELQNTLAKLGPDVVGIRVILGEDHGYALLVTANGRAKYDLAASPAVLRSKILQVREELRNPRSDPRPLLSELYSAVVAPMESELHALERNFTSADKGSTAVPAKANAPTILWSLDGSLRYLPMAALFDGHRYMIERFNNVLFTPESYMHMGVSELPNPTALAMGLSKGYRDFPPLPGVMQELLAIVRDPAVPASHGPLSGNLLSDEMFTYMALKSRLDGGKSVPIVHIASHFVMEGKEGSEPYLLLAGEEKGVPDGYRLTLSKLDDSSITFHGTHLLTLSACSTARPDALQNGMEVESLGMIAQKKDAEAVLATLWDVNDASTSRLMANFYARWLRDPAQGKGEALRNAQLELLQGKEGIKPDKKDDRGFGHGPRAVSDELPNYAHPYYWAPFVLTGNYL